MFETSLYGSKICPYGRISYTFIKTITIPYGGELFLMDLNNYSKEDFAALSIHALRIIAREAGVESPTTKNKSDLIDSILVKREERKSAPATGSDAPAQPVRRGKGRPPKQGYLVFNDSGATIQTATPLTMKKSNPNDKPYVDKEQLRILYGLTSNVGGAFDDEKSDFAGKESAKVSEKNLEKEAAFPGGNQENRYYSNGKNKPLLKKRYDYGRNDNKDGYNRDRFDNKDNYNKERFDKEFVPSDNAAAPVDESEIALEIKEGILEIMPDGYGFLRAQNYESGVNDAYVAAQKIKRYGLRKGDKVKAEARQTCENKPAGVVNVLTINGIPVDQMPKRANFDTLTPIYPDVRYRLEIPGQSNDFAIRSIDLIAPIGKGQRAMIVSPPKAGKTTLLKKIAHSISTNYPAARLIVLLIDERPEEVTDMQRSIDGEVVYSTFDEMPEHHTKAAELVLERAKRLVETGEDVVILMDSLTRLARAYNLTIAPTGRTLSGGIDPGALHSPKRFFGAARNIENGGSLTIIATALIDTGSRMDDVIYEEFKGTGNMEIHLDRRLSEKRIFPAIDLNRSGTRREELLLDQTELQGIWAVRKILSAGGESADATENLLNMMVKTKTNKEFIQQVNLQVISMQKQGFLV